MRQHSTLGLLFEGARQRGDNGSDAEDRGSDLLAEAAEAIAERESQSAPRRGQGKSQGK